MIFQQEIQIRTPGRGLIEITPQVQQRVRQSAVATGTCQVFCLHTSASLLWCENADPDVLDDMERFLSRLVPDGDPLFVHTAEGADDMPAHIRSVLTGASLHCPVSDGRCLLGTWQGMFLWEHRARAHLRRLALTVCG